MPVDRLSDPEDPRLDDYRDLTDRDWRRDRSAFVVEGLLPLAALVRSAFPIRSVLVAEPRLHRLPPLPRSTPVLCAPLDVLRSVTGFNVHRGVLAAADRLPLPPVHEVVVAARPALMVEGVNDLENIGALFRNAAAFGAGVVMDEACADPLYRRCVRVSLGHVLHVPWTRASVAEAAAAARRAGLPVRALTPAGRVDVAERRGPAVWLLGAEGPGLSEGALAGADEEVRITLAPGVDSLNVATAAAVALAMAARDTDAPPSPSRGE